MFDDIVRSYTFISSLIKWQAIAMHSIDERKAVSAMQAADQTMVWFDVALRTRNWVIDESSFFAAEWAAI